MCGFVLFLWGGCWWGFFFCLFVSFLFNARVVLVEGNQRFSFAPTLMPLFFKHLIQQQGYIEYAYIEREIIIQHCSLQTKNRFLKQSRWLISGLFFGWWWEWVTVGVVRKKSLIMWSLYFHPLRMCNHLKDASRLWVASLFVWCAHSEFFLLYASSSYISKKVPRFMFRCLCYKEKLYSNFDCFKSASSVYLCHFLYFFCFVFWNICNAVQVSFGCS